MKGKKEKYGDIIYNHDLVKRTMMACAFPCLVKQTFNKEGMFFEGFLPGFEFASVSDMETEDECVEYLQDMLDDEVEELVVFGKSLPNVESDEELLKKYPDYKIVYLDINVYALKEDEECSNDCSHCGSNCEFNLSNYDDYDEFEYDEDESSCNEHCHCNDNCDCGDDCHCNDNCDCGDDCKKK